MRLGYNTNGLAHHRLPDAIALLADEGYESVAITLDVGALDPHQPADRLRSEIREVRAALDRRGLACVIETGARYLLNPRKKHDPTLLDPDPDRRAHRVRFLLDAMTIGAELRAEALSFWSGALPDPQSTSPDEAISRLTEALQPILRQAEMFNMPLAFEPEPGMFIDTFARFAELDDRVRHDLFQLTIDLGHVHCIEEGDVAGHVRAWGHRIVNLHIEDMNRNVHEHLMFGEGTMSFPPIAQALRDVGYRGGLHVELSRHSHMAVEAVRTSASFLRPIFFG